MELSDKAKVLGSVIPFRFLDRSQLLQIAEESTWQTYVRGERIIHQSDWPDDRVFLMAEGSAQMGQESDITLSNPDGFRRTNTLDEGHYFGEWEVIFDVPRLSTVKALGDCRCLIIPGESFRRLLGDSAPFSQALGVIIRDRQGIFQAFDRFRADLMRGVAFGHLNITGLLDLYKALDPALHPGVRETKNLDGKALEYAVRRLPENVTRTFAFLLRDELPAAYEDPDAFFARIDTPARRRSIWEMLPGKNLILLRSGISDLTDFITCLCVYSVEAQKIRKRVYETLGMAKLRAASISSQALTKPEELRLLGDLGFGEEEIGSLRSIWPKDLVHRLYEITNHREMFSIDIRRQKADYNSRRTEMWTHQLGEAVTQVLGLRDGELPELLNLHIISSNTHSVTNCLNPWYQQNKEEILEWGRGKDHPFVEQPWSNTDDLLYALLRDYFRAFPDQEKAARVRGEGAGIHTLAATVATGIQVQIIDGSKIKRKNIDPGIPRTIRGKADRGPCLIINIDYAFGEQAEHIIRNLILLFGKTIGSVNFLGKAGSLVGRRGDILIPTGFIEQAGDLVQGIEFYSPVIGGFPVHRGPMLTVEGTLFQNRLMLQYYRRLWGVIGLEMEGAHYHRQVEESKLVGLVRKNLAQRYLYYVSDLPLDHGSTLAKSLGPQEGIPPLYAITRQVLGEIL
ncbi:MAG: cyclic nucleotide-binding domain-containing protein [Spirochaetales bacterium]|nr:cyclic nucleotide-binding domain-containing protein [Spirochaetales bacterium]